jgi:hypothetical protein
MITNEWNRDLPALEKQKEKAFDDMIDTRLEGMITRIDTLLEKLKAPSSTDREV